MGPRLVAAPFHVNSMKVAGLRVGRHDARVDVPTNGMSHEAQQSNDRTQIGQRRSILGEFTSEFRSKSLIIRVNKLCCNREAKSLFASGNR